MKTLAHAFLVVLEALVTTSVTMAFLGDTLHLYTKDFLIGLASFVYDVPPPEAQVKVVIFIIVWVTTAAGMLKLQAPDKEKSKITSAPKGQKLVESPLDVGSTTA